MGYLLGETASFAILFFLYPVADDYDMAQERAPCTARALDKRPMNWRTLVVLIAGIYGGVRVSAGFSVDRGSARRL
jgi:hypothetical protein